MSGRAGSTLIPAVTAVAVVSVTALYLWKRVKHSVTGAVSVCELNVYPVKSCAQVSLDTATPTPKGFEGDRIAQVTDKNGKYCTPRDKDKAKLFHVKPEIWGSKVILTAPNMEESLEVDLDTQESTPVEAEILANAPTKLTLRDFGDAVAAWFETATGITGCRLTGIGPDYNRSVTINENQGDAIPTEQEPPVSLADEAPYLLTNLASLDDLNRCMKQRGKYPVDMRRFRPNIVVSGLKAWEEDSLKKIRINHVEFWVWQRCGRCTMTTIDRDSLDRGPEPLATLSTFRERAHGQRNFGMHLIPVEGGIPEGATITVDDEVEILEYDEERREEWQKLFG